MLNTASALRGMVTSPHHLASQAGLSVLREGGDAIEAAVAMAACLAVVYPHMTGIGGDGFWLVAEPSGDVWTIDACGAAGRSATLDLYRRAGLQAVPWRGPLAANTVAGTVSGWELALSRTEGRLPLARLFEDAMAHAENGVAVTAGMAKIAAAKDEELRGQPGFAAVYRPEGRPLAEGEILRQPALGGTLRRLAAEGLADFYRGGVAADLALDLETMGAPVSASDLDGHEARFAPPLAVDVAAGRLFNMGPPTQGFSSLLILALFERLGVAHADGFAHVHGLVEATKLAFREARRRQLGDPAFMPEDAQAILDDAAFIDGLSGRIDPALARPWPEASPGGDTVWFAAADGKGRVVSVIQSIYFEFGSGVTSPRTGVVWQNRGASFQLAASGWNALLPGRKPFHTLNPAIARLRDGSVLAYGTMGGEGQPQTQAAVLSRVARFGAPLQAAVTAPRWLLGRTWGDDSVTLKLEDRFNPSCIAALRAAGHRVEIVEPFSQLMGHAGALMRRPDGVLLGAADPRSDGGVAAW